MITVKIEKMEMRVINDRSDVVTQLIDMVAKLNEIIEVVNDHTVSYHAHYHLHHMRDEC
tara:strand:- start:519 stop:695 length:177 start_codon:yes stop_codon:yes gene_type:complete